MLQAMVECCAERGYLQTTVTEVIARAEVRRESFEALFADKEECAVAALRKISSEVLTGSSSVGEAAPKERADRGLLEAKAMLELIASRSGYAYFSCVEARQGGSSNMHEVYQSSARVLSAMAERAREVEGGAKRPARAVRAALGGAEAVVRREIIAGRGAGLPRLAPSLLYSVLVPVVGQGEALRQRDRLERLLEEGA
jgi:AcrR family transcriptional regulator